MARVLLVTNDFPPDRGGIQTYLRELVDRTRHDVRVLAPHSAGVAPDPRVVRHPSWRFKFPTPRVRRWIVDHAHDWVPDVVVYGAPHPPALLGPSIARHTGIPYIVLAHGAETLVAAAIPGVRQALRRSLRGAAVRLAVSEFTAERVRRLAERPCLRLGVGVEAVDELPDPVLADADADADADVISVGRLVPRKGQHRLIDAVARLDGWQGTLIVVGSGRRAAALRRRAGKKGVPLSIEEGLSDAEVAARLRGAAVFALPCRSRWFGLEIEGLGIAFLEAAAAGLPVIVGRSGGAPETILPGVTGFLAERPREIAAALQSLLADPALRRSMGEAGRQFVADSYGWTKVIDLFDSAVAEAAGDGVGT